MAGQRPWADLDRATQDPRSAQRRLLHQILARSRGTRFGRDFGLERVASLDDYRGAVPIADYERFRPYVDRIVDGDLQALTAEAPQLMTITSGTTGQPKLLPVTAAHARASADLTRAWLYRVLLDHPRSLDGSFLAIVSPDVEGHTPGGMRCASASGQIYRDTPLLARRACAAPAEVLSIHDPEAKYYAIARVAAEADVTFIGTPNPSTLVRLSAIANGHREELIRDVAEGSLSSRFPIETAVRDALARKLHPNRARARELERLVRLNESLRPYDLWPNLQLVGCWKGGSVGVQLDRARSWFGSNVPTRDLGYLASEAHMTVPISDAGAGGVLAVTANFYEFVAEEEIEQEEPRTLLCDEVELGQTYYVVLTTQSGLYRYDINDIVRVTGFHRRAPIVESVRKGRDMTSIGGEKLHVAQLVEAVEAAQRALGFRSAHYRAVACADQNRYVLLTEWEEPEPAVAALTALLEGVDRRLGTLNLEYHAKRASGRLDAPELYVMRPGWHERSYRHRVAAGARDVQFKETLLSSTFEEGELENVQRTVTLS